ncbi:MAG: hypothetical protein IT165_10845 [Bryobacterales bacterium]|nr:hypothetical protein [Bryobacterales bacterium]
MLFFAAALICVDCHKEIVERFERTPMANSSGVVKAAGESSGTIRRFSLAVTAEQNAVRLRWPGGEVELTFFIGSRRMGRSYAYSSGGHLFQAPVGYYGNRKVWDLPPGYERDKRPDFSRPITGECLSCHATRTKAVAGTVNQFTEIVHGVQCARCHGDAESHEGLVNPRKLPSRLRDSVCEQCHLAGKVRLARAGRRMEEFRPGRDLGEFVEVITGGAAEGVRVNGHAESLAMSLCKQRSGGRLWCGTCHNPHAREKADYNAACRACHEQPHREGNCVGCHMPKGRATDGGHTVYTDHRISGASAAPAAMRSYFGRDVSPRDLGLAYVRMGVAERNPEYLEKAWPLLRQAAGKGKKDPELYEAIGGLLESGGRREQAEGYYRLSLKQDGLQPGVMRKLAALVGGAEGEQLRRKVDAIIGNPINSR